MKKAIIYTRTATQTSDNSHELQKYLCKNFAAKNDYSVVGEYAHTGKANAKRLIEFATNKQCEFIIVSRIDRITRNINEFFKLAKELQDCGIQIVSPVDLGWHAELIERLTKGLYGKSSNLRKI